MSALYSQRGVGLIHETKLPMQELELKIQGGGGGLMHEGGVITGFYGTCIVIDYVNRIGNRSREQ